MSLQSQIAALSKCDLFASVAEADLSALVEVMREERFEEGETVCSAGEIGDRVYVVMSGTLEVMVAGQVKPVRQLREGDVFGEYGMFEAGERTATVRCLAAATLLTLDYSRFIAFLMTFPEAMFAIFGVTVKRLQALERKTGYKYLGALV